MGSSITIQRGGSVRFNRTLFHDYPVARFAQKRHARKFAMGCGWRSTDVTKGSNRFGEFWIVGQQVGESFRVLMRDGSTWDVPIEN